MRALYILLFGWNYCGIELYVGSKLSVLKQVMRSVEKIERVFEIKLVTSYIIAASVSWWIKNRMIATVTIKLKPALSRV